MVSGMMILKCPETEEHKVEEKRKYKWINTGKVGNKRKQTKITEKKWERMETFSFGLGKGGKRLHAAACRFFPGKMKDPNPAPAAVRTG